MKNNKIIATVLVLLMLVPMTVSANMYAPESNNKVPFTDVPETAWYYDCIKFCHMNGIVFGMNENTFEPNGTLTRAQFVLMLANFNHEDLTKYNDESAPFEDVKSGQWYYNAVCWAKEIGFVSGMSESIFAPNQPITREQLVKILYLNLNYYSDVNDLNMSYRDDLSAFKDSDTVSSWALEEVQWAVACGFLSGISEDTLSPKAQATRAQACQLMLNTHYYFLSHGRTDTTGIYSKIIDFLKENAYHQDYEYGQELYIYEIPAQDTDGEFKVIYHVDDNSLTFYYNYNEEYNNSYKSPDDEYNSGYSLAMYSLSDDYDIIYHHHPSNYDDVGIMMVYIKLSKDGYNLEGTFFPEQAKDITEEDLKRNADENIYKFIDFIESIIIQSGGEYQDLFI